MDAITKILAAAFDIAPGEISPEALALAIGELGYTIKKAPMPRVAKPAFEPYAPNTGNPKVDAFMRAHHNPKYRPLALPKAPGLKPLMPMRISEQDAAELGYRNEAKRAAAQIAEGEMPEAESVLRELIALHRNPWTRIRTEHGTNVDAKIYESARHPGIEIRDVATRRPGNWGSDRTFEVFVNGERHGKVHYAFRAAENAADALVAAFN